jgi:hypothetical protein
MTIDDFVAKARTARTAEGSPGASFLVYVIGKKEFFAGEIIDVSTDGLLLREPDRTEVLLLRRHIIAISVAPP